MTTLASYFKEVCETLKMPEELCCVWQPEENSKYKGKIVNGIVYVYDEDVEEAKRTVLHEIIELLLLSYRQTDRIAKTNEEAYYFKEAVVEAICRLITKNGGKEPNVKNNSK